MLTRENKIGLVLAFLLGLSDVAILGALAGSDGSPKPPVWIVVSSVVIGLATVVLVVPAWRNPTWPVMIAIIALRALSGLGDLAGLGENAMIVTISLVLLAFSVVCIALLRNWIRRPMDTGHEHRHAHAVG